MLILMGQPASERSGTGDRAFMAFKLHRFLWCRPRVRAAAFTLYVPKTSFVLI